MKLALLLAFATTLFAQNPLSGDAKFLYGLTKMNITKAADKVDEAIYAYKPADGVRTFGELIGHVADAQYMFCSAAKGEKSPVQGIEKSKKTKAELTAALKDAFAYCDAVVEGMTDAKAAEMVKFFRGERTRLGVLMFNAIHNYEHYGNLVTYMRMKGIVPPSSEGR